MKTLSRAVITAVLAGGALTVQAFDTMEGRLEECKAQVAQYYGVAGQMQFVGERQYRDGTEMKFAIRTQDTGTGYTTTRLAVCWLEVENYQAHAGENNGAMVADIVDPSAFSVERSIPR